MSRKRCIFLTQVRLEKSAACATEHLARRAVRRSNTGAHARRFGLCRSSLAAGSACGAAHSSDSRSSSAAVAPGGAKCSEIPCSIHAASAACGAAYSGETCSSSAASVLKKAPHEPHQSAVPTLTSFVLVCSSSFLLHFQERRPAVFNKVCPLQC